MNADKDDGQTVLAEVGEVTDRCVSFPGPEMAPNLRSSVSICGYGLVWLFDDGSELKVNERPTTGRKKKQIQHHADGGADAHEIAFQQAPPP